MPKLFEPLSLRSLTLRNRIGVSPMCQYAADDGSMNDWHLVHLGSRAIGGAGLIIAEATSVEPRGRITPGDAGLWDDKHIEPLARVARFVHQHGAALGVQLAHAGRKAGCARPWEGAQQLPLDQGGWKTVGPSPIAFKEAHRVPAELSIAEIRQIQDDFVAAARRAHAAGVKLIELHAAHGYLAHSFLSPISNHRTDEFGGSLDNRIRFVVSTAERLREAWPSDLPLAVRISATDWAEGGWTLDDSVYLAKRLRDIGVDAIDCSSGGSTLNAAMPAPYPGLQVPFADRIRKEAGIPTMAVGEITTPEHAESILQDGRADIILLGREMLRDAYWPYHAAVRLGTPNAVPLPPNYAYWVQRT